MMKRIALVAMALTLVLGLSACGQKPVEQEVQPPQSGKTAMEAVQQGQDFEELTEIDSNRFMRLFEINDGLVSEGEVAMDASRSSAEIIAILNAVDMNAVPSIVEALTAYRDLTLEEYRDYRPDEVPKLENAVIKTNDLQVALIVSKDAEKAENDLMKAWGRK